MLLRFPVIVIGVSVIVPVITWNKLSDNARV